MKINVAAAMRAGTNSSNTLGDVDSSKTAPTSPPNAATSSVTQNRVLAAGICSRSENAPMELPGNSAKLLEALAMMGERPVASMAGNVNSEAPPAMELAMPPKTPATTSMMICHIFKIVSFQTWDGNCHNSHLPIDRNV